MIVAEHPSWSILDSSKLDDYITCPRMFFYRHILGWRPDVPAHDLHFGSAWHKAREHQLLHGYEDIKGAYDAFLAEYRKFFAQEDDSLYVPKTPTGALNALMVFASERKNDLRDNELVELGGTKMTEISGTVPISDDRVLHYRMDSIIRRKSDGRVFSWDHKTTSGKYINNAQWADQFALSIQNGTYTHCLYCLFPLESVLGVEFCGVGFEFLQRGSAARSAGYHCTLRRVPAFKTPEQMNSWLWFVNGIVDELERDMDRLSHCKEGDPVMMAFRYNPKSCTAYRGCAYLDYCMAWQNPLQYISGPPLGFRQEYWDPRSKPSSVTKNLEWR